jgi:hypothetical protein
MLSPGRSIVYSKIESAGKLDKTEEVSVTPEPKYGASWYWILVKWPSRGGRVRFRWSLNGRTLPGSIGQPTDLLALRSDFRCMRLFSAFDIWFRPKGFQSVRLYQRIAMAGALFLSSNVHPGCGRRGPDANVSRRRRAGILPAPARCNVGWNSRASLCVYSPTQLCPVRGGTE